MATYPKSPRHVLHQRLIKLRNVINMKRSAHPNWFGQGYGLCANYGSMCRYEFGDPHILAEDCEEGVVESWPLFSGDITFPVPASEVEFPDYDQHKQALCDRVMPMAEYAYDITESKYDEKTEYGRARLDLLDYLIEQTRG